MRVVPSRAAECEKKKSSLAPQEVKIFLKDPLLLSNLLTWFCKSVVKIPQGAGPTFDCSNPSWWHIFYAEHLPGLAALGGAAEHGEGEGEQRAKGKCRSGCGWRMWWCHRAQREHGAFKKPKETSWPSLVTSPPGSHTHTAESPSATRGKKAPSHHRICTGKNVSELWFAFPTSGASGGLGWISQQRVAGEVMLMNGSREADAEVWCSFSSRDMSSGLLCWLSSLWIKWKTMIHKNNNRMQVLYQRLRWLHSRKFFFWKVKPVRNLISVPFFWYALLSANKKDKEQSSWGQYSYDFTGNQFSCFQDNFTPLGPPLLE